MIKRSGFTLAEVLITLGIIGVVAAMTMPTLINQTNGAQYKAAYKKALSAISQGITLNVALDDKSFADATVASTTEAPDNSVAGFLKSRMNVVSITNKANSGYTAFPDVTANVCSETTGTGEDAVTTIVACDEDDTPTATSISPDVFMFFNDSSMFAFPGTESSTKGGCTVDHPCVGIVDVNGLKGPNKVIDENSGDKPTDIYPVVYYDQTILPGSAGAKAVLYGK